jgi:hypothetical protein
MELWIGLLVGLKFAHGGSTSFIAWRSRVVRGSHGLSYMTRWVESVSAFGTVCFW